MTLAAAAQRPFDRIVLMVLDSVGCGDAPDAADFGDAGANTLATVIDVASPKLPHLQRLGLDRIAGVPALGDRQTPQAAWGRLTERSSGKDTTSGHWELMGVVADRPFPLYPEGFPNDVVGALCASIGCDILGNEAASGTEIIARLGDEHVRSGKPIVYTSGDSVLQIAAHEDVVAIAELYSMCDKARALMSGQHAVARIIARPFVGADSADFRRTPRRRDFALPPPAPTALDILQGAGVRTAGVGKINDIFAGRGLSYHVKTRDNDDGLAATIAALNDDVGDFVFTNLVDFDSEYGHRRDIQGYGRCLEAFDAELPNLLAALGERDCLILTADHGNDPGFRGTDHTRERVPLLVCSSLTRAADLGTRATFSDVAATVLDNFGVVGAAGTSFLDAIR